MKKNRGFTLIEIMVVITVIMILMGFLMPALGRARRRARQIECMNNLRQIGIAQNEYALDFNGSYAITLPPLSANNYVTAELLNCPSGGSYSFVTSPANEASLDPAANWVRCSINHGGAAGNNVLRGDGSVINLNVTPTP